MTSVQVVRGELDDERRGALLFGGALLIFPQVPGVIAFRDRIAVLVRERFHGVDPLRAHVEMGAEALAPIVADLRKEVRTSPEIREQALAALAEIGMDLADAYWDRISLRMLPPGAEHAERGTGWHRDTWGSNIGAQVNWWTPIFPITEGRTIGFAPSGWDSPVCNTSATWSPEAARRGNVPLIPSPEEDLSGLAEVPVVIEPGDLLCFSAAQLHRSVPNRTGLSRFSVEIRTVTGADVRAGRGAPNLDTATPCTYYRWFSHVEDGSPLAAS